MAQAFITEFHNYNPTYRVSVRTSQVGSLALWDVVGGRDSWLLNYGDRPHDQRFWAHAMPGEQVKCGGLPVPWHDAGALDIIGPAGYSRFVVGALDGTNTDYLRAYDDKHNLVWKLPLGRKGGGHVAPIWTWHVVVEDDGDVRWEPWNVSEDVAIAAGFTLSVLRDLLLPDLTRWLKKLMFGS
ncbi:hypothetical protein ACWKWC_00175 [Geodermatophilus nigrescens]